MRTLTKVLAVVMAVGFASCEPSVDAEQRRQTEQLVSQAQSEIGMPGIANFQERRLVRMLYELRDQEDLSTWTYIVDRNGQKHLVCESVGYGIPYAVQFVNPERRIYNHGDATIPQPEPNGLFMPDALSATWVMCADGDRTRPVYVEPTVIVSPFPME